MIIGIGTDIIEIQRVKRAVDRTRGFLNRVFTDKEIAYFESIKYRAETIAGNFAAKEAISKAFGTGFTYIQPKEIEILRKPSGEPRVILYCKEYLNKQNYTSLNIHLSISHCQTYAVAFATIEGSDTNETCYKPADATMR